MSTLEKAEKRKFAKSLRAVGTAATIRENVVKDLRESAVLVRWIGSDLRYTSFRFCRQMHDFTAFVGAFWPFLIGTFRKNKRKRKAIAVAALCDLFHQQVRRWCACWRV